VRLRAHCFISDGDVTSSTAWKPHPGGIFDEIVVIKQQTKRW
jgi:hypothetical protein